MSTPSPPNTPDFCSDLSSAEIFPSCSSISSYSRDEPFPSPRKPASPPHLTATSKGACIAASEFDSAGLVPNEAAGCSFPNPDSVPTYLRFNPDEYVSDSYSPRSKSPKTGFDAEVSVESKERVAAEAEEYVAMELINAAGDEEEEEEEYAAMEEINATGGNEEGEEGYVAMEEINAAGENEEEDDEECDAMEEINAAGDNEEEEEEECDAMEEINAAGDNEEEEEVKADACPSNTGFLRFRPLYTKKDEIMILEGMMEHPKPVKLSEAFAQHFHGLIAHSLSREITCSQLYSKLRKLKQKYSSLARVPSKDLNSHEKKLVKFGKKIWDAVQDKEGRVRPEDLKKKFPFLTEFVFKMPNGMAREFLEKLGPMEMEEFEKRIHQQKMAHMKHFLRVMGFNQKYCKWATKGIM